MTLVLRTFKELKDSFDSTIRVLGGIDKIEEPRKSEVLYIQWILNTVKDSLLANKLIISKDDVTAITPTKKNAAQVSKDLNYYSSVCYGAMLFIINDITLNLKTNLGIKEKAEKSRLFKRLHGCMGTTENPLTPHQITTCYRDFNKFLNTLFKEHDSRNGFKKVEDIRVLDFMELNKLVSWTKTGYALEQKAYEKQIKAFTVESETAVTLSSFKLAKELPKTLIVPYKSLADKKESFTDISWKEMEESLKKLIDLEINTKGVANLSELKSERSIQLQFLTVLADCLSGTKFKPEDKMAILVGSMFLIRGKIAIEYKLSPLHKEVINSSYSGKPIVVHTELGKLLQAEDTSFQDIEAFLLAANDFIEHLTLDNSKENAVSIRTKHLFSDIKGFNLKDMLTTAQTVICECRTSSIQECLDKELAILNPKLLTKEQPEEKSSWFFGSKKKKGPEPEVEDFDALFGKKEEENATMTI